MHLQATQGTAVRNVLSGIRRLHPAHNGYRRCKCWDEELGVRKLLSLYRFSFTLSLLSDMNSTNHYPLFIPQVYPSIILVRNYEDRFLHSFFSCQRLESFHTFLLDVWLVTYRGERVNINVTQIYWLFWLRCLNDLFSTQTISM